MDWRRSGLSRFNDLDRSRGNNRSANAPCQPSAVSGHPRCSCHLRSPTQIHAALSLPVDGSLATLPPPSLRQPRPSASRFAGAARGEDNEHNESAEVTRRRKKQSKRRRGEARSERVEARDFYASPRNKTKGREKEEGNRSSAHGTGEERRKRERKSETLTASRGGAG